jgi:hypothetical protein
MHTAVTFTNKPAAPSALPFRCDFVWGTVATCSLVGVSIVVLSSRSAKIRLLCYQAGRQSVLTDLLAACAGSCLVTHPIRPSQIRNRELMAMHKASTMAELGSTLTSAGLACLCKDL